MTDLNPMRRSVLRTAAAALPLLGSRTASAQSYPTRPITFIVPFPPGGTSDTMARLVAQEMSKALGQPMVVENRPGANGNLGSAAVARAAPDGYTLLLSGVGSHAINVGLYRSMPYDPVRDFAHVSLIASGPNAIAVHPGFTAGTLADLIAMAKRQPGSLSYASSGTGSSGNMAMELFKQRAGLRIEHIPYRGGAPAMTDVIAGTVPILVTNADAVLPHARDNRLRTLAVTSAERSPLFPEVPTIAGSGYPDVVATSWTGMSAPPATPPAIIARLQAELARAVNGPLKDRLLEAGLVPGGSLSSEFSAFVAAEVVKWRGVAQAAGLTAE